MLQGFSLLSKIPDLYGLCRGIKGSLSYKVRSNLANRSQTSRRATIYVYAMFTAFLCIPTAALLLIKKTNLPSGRSVAVGEPAAIITVTLTPKDSARSSHIRTISVVLSLLHVYPFLYYFLSVLTFRRVFHPV